MSRLSLCMKKDRIEFLRSKKLAVCIVFLAVFMVFVLALTAVIPQLSNIVSSDSEFITTGIATMVEFLKSYFPQLLSDSTGFFSTEIGLFYSILVIAFSFSVLPKEIKSGRLILPICNGYQQKEIFLSKQIVYALFCSIPAGVAYFLYYLIGSTFLVKDCTISFGIIGALATCFNVFSIVCITIALSVIYKHSVLVVITMGLTVAASPDLLFFLPFGRYIPTYILTYLNYAEIDPTYLIIPAIEYAVIILLLDVIVIKRKFAVVVDERR